ncbi:MAG: hypothetical protein V3S24_02455 [Candidatus Tectomicrobia bacterium]
MGGETDELAHCPHSGGPVTIIATIDNPAVMAETLAHLGLPTRAPPRSPARTGDLFQTA